MNNELIPSLSDTGAGMHVYMLTTSRAKKGKGKERHRIAFLVGTFGPARSKRHRANEAKKGRAKLGTRLVSGSRRGEP